MNKKFYKTPAIFVALVDEDIITWSEQPGSGAELPEVDMGEG